jgi:RNA ligase
MVKITDLFTLDALGEAIDQGYVKEREHPELPLWIYNYTDKTQFDQAWNDVTHNCRGLIVDDKLDIVARPFRKFFNYGDPRCPPMDLNEMVMVTDKLDGSLGIGYPTGEGPAIATRGSFTSDQALHATELLRTKYKGWQLPLGITPLWEIIYPENRIVLDYEGMDDLVLLGGIVRDTGEIYGPNTIAINWPWQRAETLWFLTVNVAVTLADRQNKEGVVLRFEDGRMVKVKQADYVALHKLVTRLSARSVWERMGAGETVSDICAQLPDEFHKFVIDVGTELLDKRADILHAARDEFWDITQKLGKDFTRKEFAALACQSQYAPYLFMYLDEQDIGPNIWKSIKPEGERKLLSTSEDTA